MRGNGHEGIGVLWGEILQFLNPAECIHVLGNVNKSMHELVYSAEYWGRVRRFCLTSPMSKCNPRLLSLMFTHMKAVQSFRFEFPFSVSPDVVESVLHVAFTSSPKQQLTILDLSSIASSVRLDTMQLIAERSPGLENICFANSSSLNHDRILCTVQRCRGLKHLDLTNCVLISTQSLFAIAEHLPHLQSIILESCDLVDDSGISRIAHKCTNLTRVSVSFCRRITNLGIRSLLANPSLEHLEARYCHLSDRLFDEEKAPRGGSLKFLDIKASSSVTDSSCIGLASQFPALENLDISLCPLISAAGVWDLLRLRGEKHLKPMSLLNITGCRINNDDFEHISNAFPETHIVLEKTQKLKKILDLLARGWSFIRPQ
eukprot:TRINITY_DN20064_c0_g2_i1.p1 TRINITY_DN20064_c0_g2~~TRINITY_DN20064_c0_g2_i1.p1  ORF type:complete len:374 (-),score=68.37 TRINITY_DN20064_c0_g2_i1:70-1191(-)